MDEFNPADELPIECVECGVMVDVAAVADNQALLAASECGGCGETHLVAAHFDCIPEPARSMLHEMQVHAQQSIMRANIAAQN